MSTVSTYIIYYYIKYNLNVTQTNIWRKPYAWLMRAYLYALFAVMSERTWPEWERHFIVLKAKQQKHPAVCVTVLFMLKQIVQKSIIFNNRIIKKTSVSIAQTKPVVSVFISHSHLSGCHSRLAALDSCCLGQYYLSIHDVNPQSSLYF